MRIKIKFDITVKQQMLIDSVAFIVFYGGQAGGGKTYGTLIDAYLKSIKYPGMKQLVLRKTFPELKRSLILKSNELFDRQICTYNESEHVWKFINGSRIEFGYCERDSDVGQYQSAEYDMIRFDESTHFSGYVIDYMKSRVRGVNNFPKGIRLGANPGGVGHAYHYEKFIRGKNLYEIYTGPNLEDGSPGETSQFIPASLDDNIPLKIADPNYRGRLEQLPEKERKMLLYGDWECFEGRYFNEFKPSTFRETPFYLPDNAVLYASLDHGTTAPTSFGLWWIDGDKIPHRLMTYYKANRVTSDHAFAAAAMCASFPYSHGRPPRVVFADPSMWTKGMYSSASQHAHIDFWQQAFSEVFARFTEYKTEFVRADNDINSGCAIMREYLREQDGFPRLRYFDKYNLPFEKLIPEQIHDKYDPERYDSGAEDHIADDTRYYLKGIFASSKQSVLSPKKKKIDKSGENTYLKNMMEVNLA